MVENPESVAPLQAADLALVLALAQQGGDPTPEQMACAAVWAGVDSSALEGHLRRCQHAGLLLPGTAQVRLTTLLRFLAHGVAVAFPAFAGEPSRGVPTAHAGPVLAEDIEATVPYVWAWPHGTVIGRTVAPLIAHAPELAGSAPAFYAILSLVDALRVGMARERHLALVHLAQRLAPGSPGLLYDAVGITASSEALAADAARWHYVRAHSQWIRRPERIGWDVATDSPIESTITLLAVRVPDGSDLSCAAMCDAAIDAMRRGAAGASGR